MIKSDWCSPISRYLEKKTSITDDHMIISNDGRQPDGQNHSVSGIFPSVRVYCKSESDRDAIYKLLLDSEFMAASISGGYDAEIERMKKELAEAERQRNIESAACRRAEANLEALREQVKPLVKCVSELSEAFASPECSNDMCRRAIAKWDAAEKGTDAEPEPKPASPSCPKCKCRAMYQRTVQWDHVAHHFLKCPVCGETAPWNNNEIHTTEGN
jgi:hypothetical protein